MRRKIAEISCVEFVLVHIVIIRMMTKLGYGNSCKMIDEPNQLDILPLIIEHDIKKK